MMIRMRKIFSLLTVLALMLGIMAQPMLAGDLDSGYVVAAAGSAMPGCDDCPPDGDAVQTACHACAHFPAFAGNVPLPGMVAIRLASLTRTAIGRTTIPDPHPPRSAIV